MFIEEAFWIGELLKGLNLRKGQTVLDLGSSTEEFRCLWQPHIDYYIFRPLRNLGVKIVHIDSRRDEGVDITCDLASPATGEIIGNIEPGDIVLCTHLLEHVLNRELLLDRVKKLTKPKGIIIITAPYIYRYHPDPIDTMFRPINNELEAMFPGQHYRRIASKILEVKEEALVIPIPKKHVIKKIARNLYCLFLRTVNRIFRELHLSLQLRLPGIIFNKVSILVVEKKSHE